MSLPTWPSDVPYRSLPDGWGAKPYRTPLETDMDGGNVRVRRRPGDGLGTMSWKVELTAAQMASFRSFVETTLRFGTARFSMPVTLDGSTYETRTVQIVGGSLQYSTPGGGVAAVQMDLRVFPASVVS